MIDPVTFSVAVLVPVVIGLPIALTRRGGRFVKRRPSRLTAWSSPLPPAEALRAAVEQGRARGYRLDTLAEAEGCVVLASSMTAFTWGFFHPVYAKLDVDGRTRVEIGIASRFFQYGPLVTRAHHRFMEALGAPLRLSPLP